MWSATRKYKPSCGEPLAFDADGTLRDSQLSKVQAEAMITQLSAAVPDLARFGRITLDWSKRNCETRLACCYPRGKDGNSAALVRLFPGGQQEKTLLHELAHALAPSGAHHNHTFGRCCLTLQAAWLKIKGTPVPFTPAVRPVVDAPEPWIITRYRTLRSVDPSAADKLFKSLTAKVQSQILAV